MKGLLRRAAKHTTVPVRLELCEPRLLLFAGQLDLAFGDLGTASRSLAAPIVAHATALARQPDGKILLAGDDAGLGPAPLVARHLPDGRLDPTFAQAGRLDLAFERTFNSGDFTTGQPKAILVQKSGRIVLVTESTNNLVILALRPDGTPDTTFGSQGRAALFNTDYNDSTPIHSAILLPDQSILVGASLEHYKTTGDPARPLQLTSSAAAYLHVFADGTIDPEYDGHFRTIDLPAGVTQASIERLAPLKSGGALAVGRAGDDLLLAKITPSGHVARTFGDARGFTLTDFGQPAETARALLPLDEGSVVVSGDSAGDIVLARYAADGRLLPTFGAGGKIRIDLGATETATDLLTTSDGRLLVVGNSADNPIVVSLLRRRGRLDRAYANAGVARITFTTDPTGPNTASAATLLPGDSLLLAGTASGTAESVPASRLALARLRPDGSTDRAFAATPTAFRRGVDFRGTKVARQSDGKLVTFSTYDQAQTVAVFMRFLPDGRPDTTFAAGGVLSVPVKPGFSYAPPAQLRIDSKGRLLGLIVSNQTCPNGPRESIVLRVTPTGTLDDSFADAGLLHPGFVASALAVTDGHLLLAGGRAAAFVLRRFDHAGRPDPSFGNAGEAAVTISREPDTAATPTDLLVAPDGAIVAVGGLAFGTSNFFYSASRFAVARFTARTAPPTPPSAMPAPSPSPPAPSRAGPTPPRSPPTAASS